MLAPPTSTFPCRPLQYRYSTKAARIAIPLLSPSTKDKSTSVDAEEEGDGGGALPGVTVLETLRVEVKEGVRVPVEEEAGVLEGVRVPVMVREEVNEATTKHSEVTGPVRLKLRKGVVASSQPSGMGAAKGLLSALLH